MRRILVTGFGPFPGVADNPSATIVRAIETGRVRPPPRCEVVTEILPTSWDRVAARTPRLLAEARADMSLHFGLHRRARAFHIERVARNQARSLPDADGARPGSRSIRPRGPARLRSGIPAERIVAPLRAAGVPARASNHAGDYICNQLYYLMLAANRREGRGAPSLFVHVPDPAALARRADLLLGARTILRACASLMT